MSLSPSVHGPDPHCHPNRCHGTSLKITADSHNHRNTSRQFSWVTDTRDIGCTIRVKRSWGEMIALVYGLLTIPDNRRHISIERSCPVCIIFPEWFTTSSSLLVHGLHTVNTRDATLPPAVWESNCVFRNTVVCGFVSDTKFSTIRETHSDSWECQIRRSIRHKSGQDSSQQPIKCHPLNLYSIKV